MTTRTRRVGKLGNAWADALCLANTGGCGYVEQGDADVVMRHVRRHVEQTGHRVTVARELSVHVYRDTPPSGADLPIGTTVRGRT